MSGGLGNLGEFTDGQVGPVGVTAPTQAGLSGGVDGSGNLQGVSVDSTGKQNINNISGTVSLPTGASTSSLQTTGNTSVASIDTKTPTIGQKTMSGSSPVAIASDQSAIPASQSGTWNINNVSGTVSLPTGASTSALQTTGNASLSSIDTKTPALGQAVMASSTPVVIASNQSAVSVTPTAYSFFHPIFTTRVQFVSGATGSATTSLPITITSSRAASLIAVAVSSAAAATITVTDNLAQSYSTAISGTSGTHTNYIFYKANSAAGVTTVTISANVNSGMTAVVTEYFGVSTSPLDKTATANVTSTAFSSGATAATTSASELLLGSAHGISKNNSTYTAGTSWSTVALINAFNAAAGQLYLEEQYVQATGTQTATGTASASDTIITNIATFVVNGASNLTIINQAKVIKSGSGTLSSFTINTVGTGGATATLYDGTSTAGTVIATIALTNAGNVGMTLNYNISFATGLTLVLNSATSDVTVAYA